LHLTDSLSNAIIPHMQNGVMDRIHINTVTGENSVIVLNEQGLPVEIYHKNVSIMLGGYDLEKGTVNVAKFPTDSIFSGVYEYGVPVQVRDLQVLMDLHGGRKSADLGDALQVIGTVFSITGCVVSFIPPFTPWGAFVGAIGCGTALYDAIKIINPDTDNQAASAITAVHNIKMNLINCLKLVGKPKDAKELYEGMYGCYGLAIEAAKGAHTLYQEYRTSLERDLAKQKAILETGFGDIKITLDWNTTADIDLWVIEPNGEKIYYRNRTTSNQGELDLDDTDGYGPENVFWPTDKAPLGNYKVQIHYYGPSSGVSTSYRVVVNNFGRSKTFTGSIAYNQVVTIAQFEAGARWDNAGGRMAMEITNADRSTLPTKF
jgi:hypothetical protein